MANHPTKQSQTNSIGHPVNELPVIKFPSEQTTYVAPSWDELNQLLFAITQQINAKQLKFDRIVTLTKGGWPMSRSLVDFLSIESIASIGVKFYTGINERLQAPTIYQELPVSVVGERVLLFDDVADTGKSLQFVANYLREKGVATLTTATLFYKPHSVIKPDFYGAETTDWIIFPYEMVETLQVLGKRWQVAGIATDEVANRFAQLGFRRDWVMTFLPVI